MPTPSHGQDCISKTYPTQCWYCYSKIWVYQCNHGSVLLFDLLGNGWPRHECDNMPPEYWSRPYIRTARPQVDTDKIERLIEREVAKVRRQLKPSSIPFRTVSPTENVGETLQKLMVLREPPTISARVTKLDSLGSFVRASMGIDQNSSASDIFFQITLMDSSTDPSGVYNAMIDKASLEGIAIERNIVLGVTLESRGFGDIAEWFVTDITPIENAGKPE